MFTSWVGFLALEGIFSFTDRAPDRYVRDCIVPLMQHSFASDGGRSEDLLRHLSHSSFGQLGVGLPQQVVVARLAHGSVLVCMGVAAIGPALWQ